MPSSLLVDDGTHLHEGGGEIIAIDEPAISKSSRSKNGVDQGRQRLRSDCGKDSAGDSCRGSGARRRPSRDHVRWWRRAPRACRRLESESGRDASTAEVIVGQS